jgi:hypothetical protein
MPIADWVLAAFAWLAGVQTPQDTADLLVTWMAAIPVLRYVLVLAKRRDKSLLERRMQLLLILFGALLVVRGFSWLWTGHPWLVALTFLPATLLPLALTLFTEALLRRHVPRLLKLFVATATIVALAANVVRAFVGDPRLALSVALFTFATIGITILALAVLLALRDRASLSRVENTLVRVCAIVAAVALPLLATDFRVDLGWPPVRLGAVGVLLFCYSMLRHPQENARPTRWLVDVAQLVARALIATGLVALLLPALRGPALIPIASVAVTFVLSVALWDRLRETEQTHVHTEVLQWLARETPQSIAEFRRELRHLWLTADAVILEEEDLEAYDSDALLHACELARRGIHSLTRLRAWSASHATVSDLAARGVDQLLDLLERRGATHVALFTSEPLRLLIATLPELPAASDPEIALAAAVRRGQAAAMRRPPLEAPDASPHTVSTANAH